MLTIRSGPTCWQRQIELPMVRVRQFIAGVLPRASGRTGGTPVPFEASFP
jgi:hypothetical protein